MFYVIENNFYKYIMSSIVILLIYYDENNWEIASSISYQEKSKSPSIHKQISRDSGG